MYSSVHLWLKQQLLLFPPFFFLPWSTFFLPPLLLFCICNWLVSCWKDLVLRFATKTYHNTMKKMHLWSEKKTLQNHLNFLKGKSKLLFGQESKWRIFTFSFTTIKLLLLLSGSLRNKIHTIYKQNIFYCWLLIITNLFHSKVKILVKILDCIEKLHNSYRFNLLSIFDWFYSFIFQQLLFKICRLFPNYTVNYLNPYFMHLLHKIRSFFGRKLTIMKLQH